MTVLGPVAPDALGPTLMHEHLLCDLTPPVRRGQATPEVEITLENAFDVAYRPQRYPGNHRLQDVPRATQEARWFREAGGGCIVDVTTGGIVPDPLGLQAIARDSGVHVVLGAGFYTAGFVDEATRALPEEALAETMIGQLTAGAWGTPVRCGIIGEIGCSWPLEPFERRCLAAAASAQRATGAAITIHPGRHPDAPHEILDVLETAGADLSRVVIGHMDRTYDRVDDVLALARRGCCIEYDFFGIETSLYWMGVVHDLPTDWMRVAAFRRFLDAGLGDRFVASQDICTRSRWRCYGGHGYGHLVANVGEILAERGFSLAERDLLLVETPRRLLTLPGRA